MWNLPALLQFLASSSQPQTQQRHTDAVQGDLSVCWPCSCVCCKRTSIEQHVAGTEVRGLNLVGPVNSMQGKQNWTGI